MARDVLIPDPLYSDGEYQRFYHLDLPELDDTQLTDEVNYIRPLLWRLESVHWLRARAKMIEGEIRKRRGDTAYKARGQRKPKPAYGVRL